MLRKPMRIYMKLMRRCSQMELKKIIKDALGLVRCRLACVKSGKGVYIGSCVHFVNGKNVTLADDVQVRPGCDLFAGWQGVTIGARSDIGERNRIAGDVVIGEAVLFGPDNYICSEDHCFSDVRIPVLDQGSFSPKKNGHSDLRIGDGSWIGCHCAIVGDVHIGRHCIVGANSVVTHDNPDYCVVVGAPARIVRHFDFGIGEWVRGGQ